MNKNLLAFFLAAISLTMTLSLVVYIGSLSSAPVIRVNISGKGDATPIVSAVNGLHLSNVEIHTSKSTAYGPMSVFSAAVLEALGVMLISATVGALYKFYCTKLGIAPTL